MTVSRVWDLRRGDTDDDRMSPYAGGLRSLVLSAILEFNYLMAPIGFLALIIAPALLVGIAPSIVATYGNLLLHSAKHAERNLAVALGFFILLAGVALWIGRPLLSTTFRRFRHLHYILVYPIFVAVRETLVVGIERLGKRTATPVQLWRKRRLGTVLAALLFAAGGLLLALSVELSLGLKILDVEHVRIWAVILAMLGNAAVILGFSTAVESLYWLWRELHLKDAVIDWVPPTSESASHTLHVAHLSDLHIVGERYGFRMEAGTHGPRGNRCIRNTIRKLSDTHKLTPLDRVLVSGDITDAGTRAEWAAFIDLLRGCPELRQHLSFVPGNHDVNIVDRTNAARLDVPWSAAQALRKFRFVVALDAIQGERAHIVDRASRSLGPSLHEYLQEGRRLERLRALAERGAIHGRWEMAKIWDAIFPLVEPPPTGDGYGLILLDSNAASHFSLTNAIGVVDPSQLAALKSVLRNSPGRAWIILLHHQVVEYPISSIRLRDRIGLALINGPDVLAAITPYASRVLVLHGHRHKDWIGTCGKVVLCSAPSASMGCDKEIYRGSFNVHELALAEDGGIRLASTQHVRVA
jgi:3',5'-cyclic AMP phosphodiesterase CpdA